MQSNSLKKKRPVMVPLCIKITEAELRTVRLKAKDADVPLSRFLINKALDKEPDAVMFRARNRDS